MSDKITIKEMTKEDIENYLAGCEGWAKAADFSDFEAMSDFKVDASSGMIKFGGGLVHYLGHALARADAKNTAKLLITFKEECTEHANLYRKWLANRNKETEQNDGA